MSDNKIIHDSPEKNQLHDEERNVAPSSSEVSSIAGSVKTARGSHRVSSSSERQIKFERAQKCLENAALVSKRIKEHRKATAELLGRPFEEDDGDTASEMASTMSERTAYSVATDTSTTLSVQDALNIPGISESLANTLKQKEILMERIKQYKEISKRPSKSTFVRKESIIDSKLDIRKAADNSDIAQLTSTIKEKENALNVMLVKMKAMETTILDLQEKLNEKDQIIESKNMATTLMSDSLSKKEKDSLSLLEDTKMQMIKMQENFIAMETEWNIEKQTLLKDIQAKDEKICNLEEANKILEASRFEISLAHSKLAEELDTKVKEISKLETTILNLTQANTELSPKEKLDIEEEKGSREIASMVELTKKIELLEHLNCQIRQTNKELENKLATINIEPKSTAGSSPSKKGSPVPTRKTGRNTASKMKSPWSHLSSETLHQDTDKKLNKNEISRLELVIQSLNKEILEKEYIISQKQELISELQSATTQQVSAGIKGTDMVDIGVCTDIMEGSETGLSTIQLEIKNVEDMESQVDQQVLDIKEIEEKLKSANEQIVLLNNEIKAANKNMIKEKSTHKLKIKQMQKTIDNFSKMSDNNAEIARLNEELHQLTQKVAELEEEKGNLQLHLVDYDSGRLTESEVYKKMLEMENLAETRLQSISVLEAQKFDLVQDLHVLQQKNNEMEDKLADISQLQNEHVCSEMKSVQLEEQIDQLTASKKELEIIIENLKLDKDQLNGMIKLLEEGKEELVHKLENYMQENMELTDKLEKLSAEKVSSAESIEIVESLTTQEKLELEEYNKGMESKLDDDESGNVTPPNEKNLENLMQQSADLNKKIELFTQEREEVMAKMSKINIENNLLHEKITGLTNQCGNLENKIDFITNEKAKLQELNEELNQNIEELKRERVEILKETVEMTKPSTVDETSESMQTEPHQDDKSVGDKHLSRTKSVKQLTKEILKLKNTIKEREAEIADSQMKVLSLEEQQQKQNELLQSISSYEYKVKSLTDENHQLRGEIEVFSRDKEYEQQILHYKQANEYMQQDIQKIHLEYSNTISARDSRINELENLLLEYEKQICNYGNTIQQKDKEITEYINQITKLNDVSQKLKSTIELLEEEKAKDQNAELVKSLNKQMHSFQKKLAEYEKNITLLEEEKSQLLSMKAALENKDVALDTELQKLQEEFNEKQSLIVELQTQQQKHADEVSELMMQNKERDEEIHEIKLQLRKESIENEKLRTSVSEKDRELNELSQIFNETKENFDKLSFEKNNLTQEYTAIETKNKELLEKLKKFAVNIKKKASIYAELETAHQEVQKQLETQNAHIEQLVIQVETIPVLQDKLKHAEEEMNRLQIQKHNFDSQKSQDIIQMQSEILSLENKLMKYTEELSLANDSLNSLTQEIKATREENVLLKTQIDSLNKKIVEYEIDMKNSSNFVTKIAAMELDINQKENQITELLNKFEQQDNVKTQMQFGYDAKIQERDLYIENLEAEISKYKSRICRLEDSISIMEDRRHSLERKADQLGNQLQEKQKAYNEHISQEDELVSRLAVLMDHDRVVEKQLYEIEDENKELQNKVQYLMDDNQRLRKSLSDIQEHCNKLGDKASRYDLAESEIAKYQSQAQDRETQLKRITLEYQTLVVQKKKEIEELELEFNTQIESAFKDKKVLSEKYEKVIERVSQLELKLQEYKNNIENLNLNIEELNRVNEELITKSLNKENYVSPDYTEQYINEINKLNSVVNSKNQEISDLSSRIHVIQTNHVALVSNLESDISDLNVKLSSSSDELGKLLQKENELKLNNEQLQMLLSQKDEQIKELKETKLTFEMNIPKTEGMVISSTIEPLNEESKDFDLSTLESQIISDSSEPLITKKKQFDQASKLNESMDRVDTGNIEPIITQKKAYICYVGDETQPTPETDPFNSDEGWGLGENEAELSVTPGLTHLQDKVEHLKSDNDILKSELDTSNTKLMKALKKLKELKSSNDMLRNELKLSKQISQSSFLDSAIEDELRINIQQLEKKMEDLNADIKKERREKEAIKKQNELFNNANERLTEMKEKLDNEIELWKYKFKEANDKVSSLQWDEDTKNIPQDAVHNVSKVTEIQVNDEIMKIEKENDELQTIIDQLSAHNKELMSEQNQLKNEINHLNSKLTQGTSSSNNYEILQNNYRDLQQINANLQRDNENFKGKLDDLQTRLSNAKADYESLKTHYENIQDVFEKGKRDLTDKCTLLDKEIISLKQEESETKEYIIRLTSELDTANSKLNQYEELDKQSHANITQERCSLLEIQASKLTQDLQEAYNKLSQFESDNATLVKESKDYNDKIDELNAKIENLNAENDKLLSTVAELRSSVSSAVDQRGFEIAELWKQHLAQREADFQKNEHELRTQLSASEAKYDQLLDNVQFSSQEETSRLIMAEQLTSLQNKLQEKEDHLHSLQEKYAEVINQLNVLRSEMDDEKVTHDNRLLEQQEEYEKVIQDLTSTNKKNTDAFEQAFKNTNEELTTCKASNDELIHQNNELQNKNTELQTEISNLTKQIQLKDSEIYQKTHDYNISIDQRNEEFENVRKQLLEYEKNIEDLSFEKESELAIMRLKMHENVNHYEHLQKEFETEKLSLVEALNSKITECTILNKQITDLNKTLEEQSTKVTEMQVALENQEVEIVSLKDEISNLENLLKSSASKIHKHVSFASDTKPGDGEKPEGSLNNELLDAVPRAELDLALYMLHQRDVRCEELTMELTQLLEERDTLQLRLSDSLRTYEDLKSRCKPVDSPQPMNITQEPVTELPSFSIEREHQFVETHRGQTSRSSSISDPDGERPKLQAKLSELRSVRHSRDVRLRHESEQRQLDLRLLRSDVANLPPEAVSQLTQAHHTFSRDSQSTPTVLLNWLRGKSTPKVVDM